MENQLQLNSYERNSLLNFDRLKRNNKKNEFSSDELKILNECFDEGFYGRAVPCSLGLSAIVYYAIHNGYLKSHRVYGVKPKICLSLVTGLVLGLYSYRSKCREKFQKLYDLPYVNKYQEELAKRDLNLNMYNTFDQPDSLNLNTEQTAVKDIDDFRGHEYIKTDPTLIEPKPTVTYEELRKKNREGYANRKESKIYQIMFDENANDIPKNVVRSNTNVRPSSAPAVEQNKYGDEWITK